MILDDNIYVSDPRNETVLVECFKAYLYMFMAQNQMMSFGPRDHVARTNAKGDIEVSYVMRPTGHIQMTITLCPSKLDKYMSFEFPSKEEIIN